MQLILLLLGIGLFVLGSYVNHQNKTPFGTGLIVVGVVLWVLAIYPPSR